jgi:methionine-S-sulfoxide reductase
MGLLKLFPASKAARDVIAALAFVPGLLAIGVSSQASSETIVLPPPAVDIAPDDSSQLQTAVFSGGCFWGVQAVFQHVKGVRSAVSGYAGGRASDAQYETVSSGTTGHAESVEVTFDPAQISYGRLLMVFFSVAHDPTQLNRQGPDRGTQYRSAIFHHERRSEARRRSLHRPTGCCEGVPIGDRHPRIGIERLLSCRGIPSGLRDATPQQRLHCVQRCAQGRAATAAVRGPLQSPADIDPGSVMVALARPKSGTICYRV